MFHKWLWDFLRSKLSWKRERIVGLVGNGCGWGAQVANCKKTFLLHFFDDCFFTLDTTNDDHDDDDHHNHHRQYIFALYYFQDIQHCYFIVVVVNRCFFHYKNRAKQKKRERERINIKPNLTQHGRARYLPTFLLVICSSIARLCWRLLVWSL